MVNLLVCNCYRSINKSVSIFHTQFVLDLFFFFKQFKSHCFYKVFLMQKSNPSTNLNHKEGKKKGSNYQLKYYEYWFSKKKYIVSNLSLGKYSWGEVFLGQLCRQQIIRKSLLLGGNFQEYIIRGQLSLG